MAQEIVTRAELPAPTPQIAKSLSPQELQDHRAKIAFEVRAHIRWFERDERVIAARLSWWCDELQDWTQEQVVWALRKWNRENPDKEPTPGHVLALMKEARGRKIAAQLPKPEPAPDRKPVTKEAALEILAKAGFAPKGMQKDE
jgi:hypothetical protein